MTAPDPTQRSPATIEAMAQLRHTVQVYQRDKALGRSIASNITARRKELGMTQERLAQLTGRKQPHIARMERQSYGRHTIHSLNALAVALETTVSELTREDTA